jgi:RNA-directed DNA polymerase
MNTIRHHQNDESASERRSLEPCEGVDLWGMTTPRPMGSDGVVGGGRSGQESAVNTGDLPGQDSALRNPAEVRAAIVAPASCAPDGTPVGAERSRVTTGGAKGGRKANASSQRPGEEPPSAVPARDKQEGEDLWQRHKAERQVWSEKMLVTLETGVKGNKWFSLIDKVSRQDVLELAWEKVRSNAGACGVDGITVEAFAKDSPKRLLAVSEQMMRGSYQPQPVKRVWIPKPGSAEKRPLGIPTVRDRVVQTALRMVIEPIFEREFAPQSYGFRPGRSCRDALRRVDELLQSGHGQVVEIDIRGYFDAIPHGRLMEEVEKHIADGRVLRLIEAFLQAEVMGEMDHWETAHGTPQGGVISPLLANIYLNPLDWKLAQAGCEMVRYADDIVVLCRAPEQAAQALEEIRQWMTAAGLELHPEKTKVVDLAPAGAHFDFLGYRFWRGKAGKVRRFVRPKSRQKLRARLKPLTQRNNGHSLAAIVAELNPILRGWYGYFRHASAEALTEMDGWVRGRLRSILRKRHGGKGRGRGRDHQRWSNRYFAELGLFCLQAARAREWPVSVREQTC